jgi:hypothetical protein
MASPVNGVHRVLVPVTGSMRNGRQFLSGDREPLTFDNAKPAQKRLLR